MTFVVIGALRVNGSVDFLQNVNVTLFRFFS